jgi:hypothetical protein
MIKGNALLHTIKCNITYGEGCSLIHRKHIRISVYRESLSLMIV